MEGPKPKSHTIGPYEVESELGRGGMSVVYRAKQATLDRMVALKVMHESFGLDSDYADYRRPTRASGDRTCV